MLVISKSSSDLTSAEQRLVELCVGGGIDVVVVPPVYHLSEASGVWSTIAASGAVVVVVSGIFSRPAEWLLKLRCPDCSDVEVLSLREFESADDCYNAIVQRYETGESQGSLTEISEDTADRWYPVLDTSRCAGCGHCFQFCLFGVYEMDDSGRVFVANPDSCKTGCPACSRICPEGAISFPLYDRDDAIAGAPGTLMSPDASARRMYYARTGAECPKCGGVGKPNAKAVGDSCDECGRVLTAQPATDFADVVRGDIESLLDDLDPNRS